MHMSKTVAQLVARLTDAFESLADDPSAQDQAANAGPSALAECVPLLAVVVELINRGPTALTIEGVESYRTRIIALLEHIRPIVEREAEQALADWINKLLDEPKRLAA